MSDPRKIYIGNLDPRRSSEYQLLRLTRPFGDIARLELVCGVDGAGRRVPRGYAFVTFKESSEAAAAIRGLNGATLNGKSLSVSRAKSTSSGSLEVTPRKLTLEESRKELKRSGEESEETKQKKIRALEAKLMAIDSKKDEFKLALPSTSCPPSSSSTVKVPSPKKSS